MGFFVRSARTSLNYLKKKIRSKVDIGSIDVEHSAADMFLSLFLSIEEDGMAQDRTPSSTQQQQYFI